MRCRRMPGERHQQSAEDFEQKRADLKVGFDNLLKSYKENAEAILSDESLSNAEKQAQWRQYKVAILQEEKNYLTALQQINGEEEQYLAETYSVSEEKPAEQSAANEYCFFSKESAEEKDVRAQYSAEAEDGTEMEY